jgi:O-antigen/teichoic acid export membrane protein
VSEKIVGADLARFGTGILLASAFGVVQVFVIPRRLDVVTYGEYRLFLLYVAYLGLLHFGLADGAFLRWAGRPLRAIRHEWPRVAGWLLALEGTLLVLALAASTILDRPFARLYVVAFAACALVTNASTLAAYALQAAGDFRGAGAVAALAPGFFVAAFLAIPVHSLRGVLAAYVASFGVAALGGAIRVARLTASSDNGPTAPDSMALLTLVHTGLPVLGANLAAGLSQFADRILVSVTVPITSFALYGFASSVMAASSAATQTLSRVALSHAARRAAAARGEFLDGFYGLIATGYGAALAGAPFFEHLVARSLPAYAPALPIVRALVVGSPFWVAIHVVLVGTLQSHGRVRRQLALELSGLALVVVVCGACLAEHVPLWGVAAGASAAAAVTWAAGVAVVGRLVPAARAQASRRFGVIVVAQGAALLVALSTVDSWIGQSGAYIVLAGGPTFFAARAARAHDWR